MGELTILQMFPDPCGSWLVGSPHRCDGGLTADQSLRMSPEPCGSGLARESGVSSDIGFDGVHIRFCGNGFYWFRSYSGSLSKSAKVTKALSPLTYGGSPRLAIPSLRSCSVGPPPSAIHGRGAHCAEPALGLPTGQVKIKSQIKSQKRGGLIADLMLVRSSLVSGRVPECHA
jgi:hypothetical protein